MKPDNQTKIKEAYRQIEEMRQLATTDGFVNMYLSELPNHESYIAAYRFVEDKYVKYFKKEKFSSYDSFRKIYARRYAKKRK